MGAYLRPAALNDALKALADHRPAILAGGTDHFPARASQPRDEDILDITALPGLRAITEAPDYWRIPCLATWTDLIEADLPPLFDGLRAAAGQIGGVQVQNAGTLCGNLCNASPAADGIPNLLALDAVVELASFSGTRLLPVHGFVLGNRSTACRPDEMVLALRIPRPALPSRGVFGKLGARRYLVISIVMVAATAQFHPDGRIAAARVAIGACGAVACRLPGLEAALSGKRPDPALVDPAHLDPITPIDDVRATAAYRREAAMEMLRRAVSALGAQ
ncbi:MAG TPA: FAD binding domain-containing protein [Acetobacteraceae bacterium]|nr:FAD binding domain-containing protein [Acetobacteraceae bacterium]